MSIFKKKNKIQSEAIKAWGKYGYRGLVAMCTGSGKTRVGVLATKMAVNHNPQAKILIICPTQTLRDVGWKEEFKKWDSEDIYKNNVETVCYQSLQKFKNEQFSLVIMDEAHNITEPKEVFFHKNTVKSVLALTATPPKEIEKKQIFSRLNIKVCYKYTLEQGVKDGVVAPFNITVIKIPLDDKTKYLSRSKDKVKLTEKEKYSSINFAIRALMFGNKKTNDRTLKFLMMNRMKLIYKFRSKTETAKKLLSKFFVGERTLIFSADIKQAEELSKNSYHSQCSDEAYQKFIKKKLNKLSCVKKLNEGSNIPDLDSALVVQLTSKDKDIIQRIGRIVRWREGHEAKIWILVSEGTQDEVWCQKALADFNPDRIKYTSLNEIWKMKNKP